MSRWISFFICALLGLGLVICGWLTPAHLRAVDANVLSKAGRKSPSLLDEGLGLVKEKKLGAAQLLGEAAQSEKLPGYQDLAAEIELAARKQPAHLTWGVPDTRFDTLLWADPRMTNSLPQPVTDVVLRLENRNKVLAYLRVSPKTIIQDLLQTRSLTNTVLFPPSTSASGQAYDAAVSVAGLLLDAGDLTAALRDATGRLAAEADSGGKTESLENALLDFMSLGQRFNYGQLSGLLARVEDLETVHTLAEAVRDAGDKVPVLFAAVQLSGQPVAVAKYLDKYTKTGLTDLGASLAYGAGAVKELLERKQRLHTPKRLAGMYGWPVLNSIRNVAVDYAFSVPWLTLMLKWLCYLAGGFFLAMAVHYGRPIPSDLERPLQVTGLHLAREFLFGLGFLLVMLLVSEPFLAQEVQRQKFSIRFVLPVAGNASTLSTALKSGSIMNQPNNVSLLTLLLFFVLQALIYTACLVKLAEIRRQNVSARMKLKLLENEDHLFDAGLYLGFVGTIISLILVSLGVIEPSLMAAYSSTSFGILFVSVFKIFHLRPVRRRLLLEAEAYAESEPGHVPTPAVGAP